MFTKVFVGFRESCALSSRHAGRFSVVSFHYMDVAGNYGYHIVRKNVQSKSSDYDANI